MLREEIGEITSYLVSLVPGRTGIHLRRFYFSRTLKHLGEKALMFTGIDLIQPENISIGDNFITLRNCVIAAPGGGRIEIGNNVSFANNVVVDAGEGGVIEIGNDVGLAHNSVLRSSTHNYSDPSRPFKSQSHTPGSIIVEDDVWVAANVILLPGTHIETGCIVGSGSVVSGTVKAFSIMAGNPARVIGKRGKDGTEKVLRAAE